MLDVIPRDRTPSKPLQLVQESKNHPRVKNYFKNHPATMEVGRSCGKDSGWRWTKWIMQWNKIKKVSRKPPTTWKYNLKRVAGIWIQEGKAGVTGEDWGGVCPAVDVS